jgi:hypothetical protein
MPEPLIPRLWLAGIALAVLSAASAQPSSVQRCEGKDGRVTYSNTQCPDGTLPVRKVNTEPPVSVEARKAAQDQAKKDTAAVKQLDRERTQEEARDRKQAEARAKAEAKAAERCERARRDLERARETRADAGRRALPVDKMHKADQEIGRREAAVAKECRG